MYLCERNLKGIDVFKVVPNKGKLKNFRENQIISMIGEEQAYRFITNSSERAKTLQNSFVCKQAELTRKEPGIPLVMHPVFGKFENYNNGEFLNSLISLDVLLNTYCSGGFDHKHTAVSRLVVEDGTDKLLLQDKRNVIKYKASTKTYRLTPNQNIQIVDGIISLTPQLFALEHILRGNISDFCDEPIESILELFDFNDRPVANYTDDELATIAMHTGKEPKELVSPSKLNSDAKVLEKLRDIN